MNGDHAMRINPPNNGAVSRPAPAPTNPYHIARAYGVAPGSRAGSGTPVGPVAPSAPAEAHRDVRPEGVRRLVAGAVPGGVQFDAGGAAQPSAGALPMYRHPADKNAAATAVNVGRSLDVRG